MSPNKPTESQFSIVKEYSQLAEVYDTKWSFYIEATTRETIDRLTLRPADRLLDVGCGTGALLHQLSKIHPASQLYGIDPVPGMLTIARHRLSPSVELCESWAENLPYASEQFDIVVSCNMFHYIRNPVTALQEMERVLRPGGQLVITDWCHDYLVCRICDLYLRLFNRAHFKTYREQECTGLLEAVGHPVVDIERYKINWLWGIMTARVTKAAR